MIARLRPIVLAASSVWDRVSAAGAIHSSRILMATGIGADGRRGTVGEGLSANLGSHMTAHWADGLPVNALAGLQMSHYVDGGPTGYKIETWFNRRCRKPW